MNAIHLAVALVIRVHTFVYIPRIEHCINNDKTSIHKTQCDGLTAYFHVHTTRMVVSEILHNNRQIINKRFS